MISRHMQYIYKEGMYKLYMGEDKVDFVGGSPIVVKSMSGTFPPYGPPYDYSFLPEVVVDGGGIVEGNPANLKLLIGVAYHSRKVCELTKNVTVIRKPAILTLFKGLAAMKEFHQAEEFFPFGFSEDDPFHPVWLADGESLSIGDILIPFLLTDTTPNRAVWARATATRLGASTGDLVYVTGLRVQSFTGSATAPENVTVEFDDFSIKF